MHVPAWFKKELRWLDPTYYITLDESCGDYEIRKDVTFAIPGPEGKTKWFTESKILALFKKLDDSAMADLRFRKWLGRRYEVPNKSKQWLEMIIKRDKEMKAKKKAEAQEMIAEGLMKMHRMETTKTFT